MIALRLALQGTPAGGREGSKAFARHRCNASPADAGHHEPCVFSPAILDRENRLPWLVYSLLTLVMIGLYLVVPGGDKVVVLVCTVDALTVLPMWLIHVRARDLTARDELARFADRLENLHRIDLAIIATRSPGDVVREALTHLRRLVPGERASVILYRPRDGMADFVGVDARDGVGEPEGRESLA
jgi:hypothetical protein